uniref:Uncharacterized protein n=1 Tax=Oryza punctata TaxID=4537 RepID=A0A0E0KVY7_ORYPU
MEAKALLVLAVLLLVTHDIIPPAAGWISPENTPGERTRRDDGNTKQTWQHTECNRKEPHPSGTTENEIIS